ncbi:MAG: hypothetical protein PHU25_05270 [Deltaproteobacteria bacterium]|nr:hypothetical protein [Deltaproteobacteria bacterium]
MTRTLIVLFVTLLIAGCGAEKTASDAANKASPQKTLKAKPLEDYKGALKNLDDKAQAIKDKAVEGIEKEAN